MQHHSAGHHNDIVDNICSNLITLSSVEKNGKLYIESETNLLRIQDPYWLHLDKLTRRIFGSKEKSILHLHQLISATKEILTGWFDSLTVFVIDFMKSFANNNSSNNNNKNITTNLRERNVVGQQLASLIRVFQLFESSLSGIKNLKESTYSNDNATKVELEKMTMEIENYLKLNRNLFTSCQQVYQIICDASILSFSSSSSTNNNNNNNFSVNNNNNNMEETIDNNNILPPAPPPPSSSSSSSSVSSSSSTKKASTSSSNDNNTNNNTNNTNTNNNTTSKRQQTKTTLD